MIQGMLTICNSVLYSIGLYFHHQAHPQVSFVSVWPSHFILSRAITKCPLLCPSTCWTPSDLGGLSSNVISFCLFMLFMRVLMAGILEWFTILFSNGPHFVRTHHYDLSILGSPTQHGSFLHWVMQDCTPCQSFTDNIWSVFSQSLFLNYRNGHFHLLCANKSNLEYLKQSHHPTFQAFSLLVLGIS